MIKETDRIYAYRVMQMLLHPFTDTAAYSLGIIDEKGNEKRQPKDKETEYYTKLHKMVFQVKQILNELPSGKQKLRKIAVAMALLRPTAIPTMYQEDVQTTYLKLLEVVMESDLKFPEEEFLIKLSEEVKLNFETDMLIQEETFSVQTANGSFNIGAASIEEAKAKLKTCFGIDEEMITTAAIDATTPRIKKRDDVA